MNNQVEVLPNTSPHPAVKDGLESHCWPSGLAQTYRGAPLGLAGAGP